MRLLDVYGSCRAALGYPGLRRQESHVAVKEGVRDARLVWFLFQMAEEFPGCLKGPLIEESDISVIPWDC